jgi:dihydrolipoamide dehydrogenase
LEDFMAETADILVIGAGPGGHAAAIEAARRGLRTQIIERQGWGGTCTHRGCIPTKALLACSRRYRELKTLGRMGVTVTNAAFDYAAMKRHQDQIVRLSALGVQKTLQESGVEMIAGEGRIVSPGQVEWTAADGSRKVLSGRNIVIAWGSEPALPTGVSLSERILDSDGLLALRALPKSLLVVGGSVIGVEFATLFAELGVKVTLIEMLERILPGEDDEAVALLARELKSLGVALHTGMRMETITQNGSEVRLTAVTDAPAPQAPQVKDPAGTRLSGDGREIGPAGALDLSAEYALICTGRRPRLHREELDGIGIRYDKRGIAVDAGLMTSVPGIYAVGDVTGGMMLAHRAMQQGKVLAARLCGSSEIGYNEAAIPSVVYTHPPIARVGLMEEEARRQGLAVEVRKSDYGANITARTTLAGSGFAKLVFDGQKLAGATIAGEQAGELIAPLALALAAGLDRRQLEAWVIPHPTLSEILVL